MIRSRIEVACLCLIGVGCLLLVGALSVSNGALEHALLGNVSRSLGWGTTLFRALLAAHGLALIIGAAAWWRSSRSAGLPQSSSSRRTTVDLEPITRQSLLILALLSVLALGLRLWHLNSDLWYDELISLLDFIRPPLGQIVTSFGSQNQHMLYSILAHGSLSLFGESAWAVRLPSVAFGVASIWALFLLGRELLGTRESLLACALMTVSYHHIWFSQNARGYMALLFFATLATWLFLKALSHDSWKFWIGYAVSVSLGVWSHMTMAFVVAAHGLLFIALLLVPRLFSSLEQRRNGEGLLFVSRLGWKPIVAGLLILSLTLQLHALALPDFLSSALHMKSLPSEWSSPWWVIIESLRSLRVGFFGLVTVLLGTVLFGVGWWHILRRNSLAAIAMILPALLGGAVMLVLDHYLWPRFFFFSMGFALLIAVHGAVTIPNLVSKHLITWPVLERQSSRAGVALALLMILASALTVPRNYAYPKQNYSGARDYVESRRGPNDAVVAVGLAGAAYERYYAPNWSVAQTNAELDAARPAAGNIWLVYTLPVEVKAYRPEIWQTIQSDFAVVKVFPGTLGGGDLVVCRQRPRNSQQAVGLLSGAPQPQ
jgi:mannosyltransferase